MTGVGPAFSDALDRALALAARAHRDQVRKGTDVPYVQHPVHVAILLLKHGMEEEVAIAGVLHDVVEDTAVSLDDVRAQFGARVAGLVDSVTERKSEGPSNEVRPWRVRKEEQLAKLDVASCEVAAIKAADALHNCHSTIRDLRAHGDVAWTRFKTGRDEQLWWYRAIVTRVSDKLGDHPLARELGDAVKTLASI